MNHDHVIATYTHPQLGSVRLLGNSRTGELTVRGPSDCYATPVCSFGRAIEAIFAAFNIAVTIETESILHMMRDAKAHDAGATS